MNTYVVISVPLLLNYKEAFERALNAATEKNLELVSIMPTKFDEVWIVFKTCQPASSVTVPVAVNCCVPWYKRLFNFFFKRK